MPIAPCFTNVFFVPKISPSKPGVFGVLIVKGVKRHQNHNICTCSTSPSIASLSDLVIASPNLEQRLKYSRIPFSNSLNDLNFILASSIPRNSRHPRNLRNPRKIVIPSLLIKQPKNYPYTYSDTFSQILSVKNNSNFIFLQFRVFVCGRLPKNENAEFAEYFSNLLLSI